MLVQRWLKMLSSMVCIELPCPIKMAGILAPAWELSAASNTLLSWIIGYVPGCPPETVNVPLR